ncbi:hypothetical protein HRG_010216 [Hirsutella rhossiliensis]|uniref:DUF7029 domain-containing protein n=1 Tax=Hirsutella rhossiliensis TaxID=111463 RepID=A0A9P8MQC2_9HYPO|nr:uncharacterized protein HRG_10216 [Hirsutella rhossiliensis]KAH0958529.1 hypothetical protein HRG_10216 [Hirsutella rhossiliensis]
MSAVPFQLPSPPAADGHNSFGFKNEQTATFSVNGPIATLSPNVHWDFDTKPAANVKPVMPGTGSQLYYGNGDPKKSGRFAFLTFYFDSPSVNLDHSDHVTVVSYDAHISELATMTIRFASQQAFDYAASTWSAKDGLILVGYVRGCGDYDKGDRCYFVVAELEKSNSLEFIVKGEAKRPDTISTGGETEWGHWVPREGGQDQDKQKKPTSSRKDEDRFSWSPSSSSTASPKSSHVPASNASATSISPSPTAPSNNSRDSMLGRDRNACKPPVDTKYGLPTACLGPFFDEDLDDIMGYEEMQPADQAYLKQLYPKYDEEAEPSDQDFDFDAEDPLWRRHRRSVVLEKRVWPFKQIWTAVKKLIEISASINKEISWKVPSAAQIDKIQDKHAKQVTSPWGDGILLKSFGLEESDNKHLEKYLNIYCVGCSVKGQARVNGRATWNANDGLTAAKVEFHTDLEFVLKIGIDAKISYSRKFETDLLDVGLPGLSYGPVEVGPWISLGASVNLEAAANGKMLAGAEMGLHDAHIVIDFKASTPVQSGWEPYFKPVFEANGEIMISAELGLPMALKVGLKVFSFEKSAKLVNEPSVKGVAQVAASVGLDKAGKFSAGFEETDGCAGILSQLTWRNKLWADAFGFKTFNLYDTDDRKIARNCIPLPKHLAQSNRKSNSTKATRLRRRQLEGRAPQQAPGPAPMVSELTPEMLATFQGGSSDELSYEAEIIQDLSYNDTNGIEFGRLVDRDEKTMVATCSNGNMYAVVAERLETSVDCSVLWAATMDNTLVLDGASRAMHYATAAMDRAGVSRLRLGPVEELPKSSRLVVWTVEYNPEADEGSRSYYLVRNADGEVFYPLVCEYKNDGGAKVFLAKSPEEGIRTLEGDDVAFSITGGYVKECHGLLLLQEEFDPAEDPVFFSLSGEAEDYFEYDDEEIDSFPPET